ncbi:hypothetical protein, partial [Dyella marensis]
MAAARRCRASIHERTSAYEKFEKNFTKWLARPVGPPYYSPPRRDGFPATATTAARNSSLQVLTDRKDDVEWAAHP